MRITLVNKIKLDGNLCPKSAEVLEKLKNLNLIQKIDRIVVADERQLSSEGLKLALKHDVKAAPFFIVDKDDGSTQIYPTYFRFITEALGQKTSSSEEISEIMASYPELDFI